MLRSRAIKKKKSVQGTWQADTHTTLVPMMIRARKNNTSDKRLDSRFGLHAPRHQAI